jgi:parvulin-like peptidyl-prolyl isomerase
MRSVCVFLTMSFCAVAVAAGQQTDFDHVVAEVNGNPITRGQVELLAVRRGITRPLSETIQSRLTKMLIDRRLIVGFLDKQRIRADRKALRRQVELTKRLIQKSGAGPDPFLTRIGLDNRAFERELETTVRWNAYLEKALSEDDVIAEFKKHTAAYDGTRIRASQILIKAKQDDVAALTAAAAKLKQLRSQIIAKEISFADAAQAHSQAPTAKNGGDVGWLTYVGRMPRTFSEVAFRLKINEVSQPVRSPFGVHLCVVTDRKEGDLSPEDARPVILRKLAAAEWNRIITAERSIAKIEE